ncbi:sensor histidine kinase [Oleiharenicola lentus]|uniref:sensor histidine kinase n=1 Tax=Oleiharenicola lentus TaxID=2508720 RepID=UPI003F67946E
MRFQNLPIQRKLMVVIMATSAVVLLLTCSAFLAYEAITFRQGSLRQLSTLGEVIATNSTAVLAFDNAEDATEVLSALRAEKHITEAALYNKDGQLFARYPVSAPDEILPKYPGVDGYRFSEGKLIGFTPVVQVRGSQRLGTLYLSSDMEAFYERLRLYVGIAGLIVVVLSVVAFLLSRKLQQQISRPILTLAETAAAVSNRHDYSVRAEKVSDDELGLLTDAFNHMLEQIQEQNRELENRVRDRTIDLEAANKELETFAYSVSHDLRTPLRAITGIAEILAKRPAGELSPAAQRSVQLIHRGVCEMDRLIDSIMSFSRLGHHEPVREAVDIEALCHYVFRDLTGERSDRHVQFHVQPLPKVKGDPTLLRQVLVNLLSNSLKFTRPRQVAEIEVGIQRSADEPHPIFFVRDNGVGFDMEQADRLFVVFQRLYHPQDFEGTGVGLAMVRRIIERHSGHIWAEGVPDKGATFFFTLPA